LSAMATARTPGVALATTIAVLVITSVGLAQPSNPIDDQNDGRQICPKGSGAAGYDADRLEDRRLKRARQIAHKHDCTVRVVKRDGEHLPVTDDLRPNRINVAVERGRIRRVIGVF
jgi:hypothetical protein